MGSTLTTIVGAGLFFIFICLSGIWLRRQGRPLNVALSTVHKLIGVAAGVFLIVTVVEVNQATSMSTLEWVAVIATGLCWAGTVATGALLSGKNPPAMNLLSLLHKAIPALTILTTAGSLYLLLT